MDQIPYTLATARPEDRAEIEALHALVFGPGRFARTAHRVRESAGAQAGFALVALRQGRLIGSVLLTEVLIGDAPALLLGPLAVHPDFQKNGCGSALLEAAVDAARARGDALIVLVGDEPYYARTGFRRVPDGRIQWPGPVDPARVLALELVPGALDGAREPIRGRR
jgi:predicted N-acetyltransferase YhbS